jgi:hypothetical protein
MASVLNIDDPAISTVVASDAPTIQHIGNNDNDVEGDADCASSPYDPSTESWALPPLDSNGQALVDAETYDSDTIVVDVQQSSEASPAHSEASTHKTDESDTTTEDSPGSEYQSSSEDETLLPSITTGHAGTDAENNDSNTTIENLQQSSEASPTQSDASTHESHREDKFTLGKAALRWTREEEEKLVKLLRAHDAQQRHKIMSDLRTLSYEKLFEKVSNQLKECGIIRSVQECHEWWDRNCNNYPDIDIRRPPPRTPTTAKGDIADASKPDDVDTAARQALDDENDSPRSPAGNKRSRPKLETDLEPPSPAKVLKRTRPGTGDKALAVSFQALNTRDDANSTSRHNPAIPCYKIRLPIKLQDRRMWRVHNKRVCSA